MARLNVPTVLLLAAPLLAAAAARAQPGPGGPPAVGVVQAQSQPVYETSEFVGRIQAINRVDLVARVTAFMERRTFQEGSEVKAGDPLYKLEQAPFEAVLQQQTAAVAQANAVLQNSSLTLGRAQALINTPAGQQSRVDDALSAQRSQAAQLAQALAQQKQAQVNYNYTEIKAPIDGQISRTLVTEGNVVGPGTGTLATIVSQDPMYVLFPVSVRAATDLRDRYADRGGFSAVVVKLRLPNGRMYGSDGKLNYVDNTISANTDTVMLRASIPNPIRQGMKPGEPGNRELTDGQFVTVIVQGVDPVQSLAIPRTAILSDQSGNYVWVIGADNKAEQRRVQLGQSTPTTAIVSSGLKEGETVVADGVQRVRPGQPVAPGPMTPAPQVPPQAPRN